MARLAVVTSTLGLLHGIGTGNIAVIFQCQLRYYDHKLS